MRRLLVGITSGTAILLLFVLYQDGSGSNTVRADQDTQPARTTDAGVAVTKAAPLAANDQKELPPPLASTASEGPAWANWAADKVGLRLLGELTDARMARLIEDVQRSNDSTMANLAALASAPAEERAREEPKLLSSLVQGEAVLAELSQGRCAIVEDRLPDRDFGDLEIYLMLGFETAPERRAALFLFPRERYPQLAAAREFEHGSDLELRRAHAEAFNRRSLEERRAALIAQLDAAQALNDLVLQFRRGSITRTELTERAAKVPGSRPLPGFEIDRARWILIAR